MSSAISEIVLLYVAFLLGLFTVSEETGQAASEVEQILDYLAQSSSNIARQPQRSHSNEHHPGNIDSSAPDIPKSINIQDLNLLYKRNNLKDNIEMENDLEKHLRLESDRLCRVTGRCGCSGGRCGGRHLTDDRTVDDIDKLLEDLDENLNREQDDNNPFNVDAQKYYNDDDENVSPIFKRIGNKHKMNDDLDVIFLEVPDSENKNLISRLQSLGDDVKFVDLRDIDLGKILNNRKFFDKKSKNILRSLDAVTLQDLQMYFEEGKRQIAQTVIEYIKGKKDSLYLTQLTPLQNKEINNLKNSHSRNPLADYELRERIMNIIFGPSNNIRVLSQPKDHNIYIPKQIYNSVRSYKKQKNLRGKKTNVLPLTAQQKERIKNKIENKIIPKHSWRRNMQEQPKYGVPFQLEVQGLGQAN